MVIFGGGQVSVRLNRGISHIRLVNERECPDAVASVPRMVARRGDLIAGGRAMMLRVYSHDITRSLVDIRRRRRDSAVRCPGSHRRNDDCKTGEGAS